MGSSAEASVPGPVRSIPSIGSIVTMSSVVASPGAEADHDIVRIERMERMERMGLSVEAQALPVLSVRSC